MSFDIETYREYVDQGLLSETQRGDLSLFCYNKACFFGGNWNDVTTKARGVLFYKGEQVNHPFDKIFNLDEQPTTDTELVIQMMRQFRHEIMDKANGHLFIISVFDDVVSGIDGPFVSYSTKGSLPHEDNELLNDDIAVWDEKYASNFYEQIPNKFLKGRLFKKITIMTEAIVDHDKHTMYENQVNMYGEQTFVILGANVQFLDGSWGPLEFNSLEILATMLGLPLVKRYDKSQFMDSIDKWSNHTDIEGYVIWFPELDFRVKVKTKEYWKLRFKNDLSPEKIIRVFRKGGFDRIDIKLPEEVSDKIRTVIKQIFGEYILQFVIKVNHIPLGLMHQDYSDPESRKELFKADGLNNYQKNVLVNGLYNTVKKAMESRNVREEFCDNIFTTGLSREMIGDLNRIVDDL